MSDTFTEFRKNTMSWFKKINPFYMFITKNKIKQIEKKIQIYEKVGIEKLNQIEKKEYNRLKSMKYSAINPSLEKLAKENKVNDYLDRAYIPLPSRICSFAATNMLIVYWLVQNPNFPFFRVSNPSRMLFYNLVNRFYNVGFDYFNRAQNSYDAKRYSTKTSDKDSFFLRISPIIPQLTSCSTAIVGACTIAYKLEKLLTNYPVTNKGNFFIRTISNYPYVRKGLPPIIAAAAGHFCDLFFTRFSEITKGSKLYVVSNGNKEPFLENNTQVYSKIAGSYTIFNMWLQRVATCCVIISLNTFFLKIVEKSVFLNSYDKLLLPSKLFAMFLACYIALPITQGYTGPECFKLKAKWVSNNSNIDYVYFDRGQ